MDEKPLCPKCDEPMTWFPQNTVVDPHIPEERLTELSCLECGHVEYI